MASARFSFVIWFFFHSPLTVLAQSARIDSPVSAVSTWQLVQLQRHLVGTAVMFTDSFATNQHGWQTGQAGNYTYELADSAYTIRRTGPRSLASARSYLQLPDSLNLNRATSFLIEADMIAPKGTVPEGGLMLGASDDTNYTLIVLTGPTACMLTRVVDGVSRSTILSRHRTVTDRTLVADSGRNRLQVEKRNGKLFVSVNGHELSGKPLLFSSFQGNGIGFVSSADTVTFQHLRVRVSR